jgi:hypothetical protein
MLFFIISYIIYNFFFNKMIILMANDMCGLFNIPIYKILKSISFFNIGVTVGKLLFFFNFIYFYIFLTILIILNIICFLLYFQYNYCFNLIRFINGVSLGVMITVLIKEMSIQYKNKKDEEKSLSLLINNNIFSLPLYLFFHYIITIKYWIPFIILLISLNIIYIKYEKYKNNTFIDKNKSLFIIIPDNFKKVYLPIYFFLSLLISLMLFTSILVILLQSNQSMFYKEDFIFNFFKLFMDKEKVYNIYKNLPVILIASCCYIFRNILRKLIFYFIFIGFFIIFLTNSISAYTLVNGLIYGIYIIYAPYLLTYVKSEKFLNSQLILYIGKSIFGFILQYFFLNIFFSVIKINKNNYFSIIGLIIIIMNILIWIFNNKKSYLFKENF